MSSCLLHGDCFRPASPTEPLTLTLSPSLLHSENNAIKQSPSTSFHTPHSVLLPGTSPHSLTLLSCQSGEGPITLPPEAGSHSWWGLPVWLCRAGTAQGCLAKVPAGTEIQPTFAFQVLPPGKRCPDMRALSNSSTQSGPFFKFEQKYLIGK